MTPDLLSGLYWPNPDAGTRSGILLNDGVPRNLVVKHLAGLSGTPLARDLDRSINRLLEKVRTLSPDVNIGAAGTKEALDALKDLVFTLENSLNVPDPTNHPARELIAALRNPLLASGIRLAV